VRTIHDYPFAQLGLLIAVIAGFLEIIAVILSYFKEEIKPQGSNETPGV